MIKKSHRLWFFQKTVIIKIVWKWINWRWMARSRILDQASHSHVQFRKIYFIHVHWTENGPEWRRCFLGINVLRGNRNHIARPKSPKYMFTERLAISLAYSSFDFKLGAFPTYNSEWIGISAVAVTWFRLLGASCINHLNVGRTSNPYFKKYKLLD